MRFHRENFLSALAAGIARCLFRTLRLEIIERLRGGPMIVGDLVDALGENQATLSKQLGVLREAGVLACRPDGRCREYALGNPALLGKIIDGLQALAVDAVVQAVECRARRIARA